MDDASVGMSALTLTVPPRTYAGWISRVRHRVKLMRLPREVRDRIYECSLIEPMRYEKKHDLLCFTRTYKPTDADPPPFLLANVQVSDHLGEITTRCICDCAKRKCLGLLGVSRQVHEEAAPLFWSRNGFCTLSWMEVATGLKHLVRPKYRGLIRELSILSPCPMAQPSHVEFVGQDLSHDCSHSSTFWDAIAECQSLTTLQIPGSLVATDYWIIRQALSMLPRLRIEFVLLIAFCKAEWDWGREGPWEIDSLWTHYRTFYAKVVRPGNRAVRQGDQIDVNEWKDQGDGFDDFTYEIAEFLKVRIFGVNTTDNLFWEDTYHIPNGLDQDNRWQNYGQVNGEDVNVEFLGLPVGRRTAERAEKAKRAKDEKQKAINGLTVGQTGISQRSRWFRVLHLERVQDQKAAERKASRVGVVLLKYGGYWGSSEKLRRKYERAAAKSRMKSVAANAEARRRERKRVQFRGEKSNARNLMS